MLQIQPELEIVLEYIKQTDYVYLRLLALVYFRMTCVKPLQIYQILEPLLSDYRKVNYREHSGTFSVKYADEIVDELLREERICGGDI